MQIITKTPLALLLLITGSLTAAQLFAQQPASSPTSSPKLFLDVHQMQPGKINMDAVAGAHAKDLAVENKYNVHFLKYWVDETKGQVFCLATAPDSAALVHTHAEAHGLLPEHVYEVTSGKEEALKGNNSLFLDIHHLGAGNVTADAVAGAHQKDLAVEKKYGVNLLDYWVNEKEGVVMCLAQAKDSSALIKTHKEAHGLIPDEVFEVKQGK